MLAGTPTVDYGPDKWTTTGRPRRPYTFEPVQVLRGLRVLRKASPPPEPGKRYLPSPIGHRLLRLRPGEPFIAFVVELGLSEFLDWTFQRSLAAWRLIREYYDDGRRSFEELDLLAAWTDPASNRAFNTDQELLRRAHTATQAHPNDPLSALHDVVGQGWVNEAFAIEVDVDEDTGLVFEYPRDIFARAWFELVDSITAGRFPRACAYCGTLFIPGKRSNEQYCPGTSCRNLAFRTRYDRSPYRREYQRRHKQVLRGTSTPEEFEAWKAANKPPRKATTRRDTP